MKTVATEKRAATRVSPPMESAAAAVLAVVTTLNFHV